MSQNLLNSLQPVNQRLLWHSKNHPKPPRHGTVKTLSLIQSNVIVIKLCVEFIVLLEGHRSPCDGKQVRQNIHSCGVRDVSNLVEVQEALDDAVVVK